MFGFTPKNKKNIIKIPVVIGGFRSATSYTPHKVARKNNAKLFLLLLILGRLVCIGWLGLITINTQAATNAQASKDIVEVKRGIQKDAVYKFDIPAQPLLKSLNALANQTETLVLFSYDLVEKRKGNAVKGHFTVPGALAEMLLDTGLVGGLSKTGVLMISLEESKADNNRGKTVSKHKKSFGKKISTLLLAVFGAQQTVAQDIEAEDVGASNSFRLEEVIVTAQKREQNLQDVPIAITALDENALNNIGFTHFGDLANKVPSLTVARYPQGSSSLVLSMRGIGQVDAVQIALDPGIGVYLDDVYLARGQALTTDLGDVERIEVLRGPQGTLYGRNTVGGAVKFVTAKPTGEFSFKEALGVGRFGYFRSLTRINLPEIAGVSSKFTYIKSDFDGWVSNPSGKDFGVKNADGFRVDLRWQPSADVLVDYTYDYGDQEGTSDYQQRQYLPSLFAFDFPLQANPARESWRGVELPHRDNFISRGHAATITWDISDNMSVKSITSYRELATSRLIDTAEAFNLVSVSGADDDQNQFSQEILFTGSSSNLNLDYNAGLFYFQEEAESLNLTGLNPSGFFLSFAVPFIPPTSANLGPTALSEAENESSGVYANVSWVPSILDENLTVGLGLRYSSDTRKASRFNERGSTDYSSWDPSITLDYQWSEDIHTYVKYSEAYRSGGFNLRNSALAAFAPEELESFEIGLKSLWWDGRLMLNLAWFSQEYTDIQLTFTELGSFPLNVVTVNAGENTTEGVEADITFIPLRGLTLAAKISYLDSTNIEAADPFTGQEVAGGFPKPYTSEWAYNLSAEYNFQPFSFGSLSAYLDYSFSDDQQLYSGVSEDLRPDYALLNARLTLADIPLGNKSTLSVALWGKNLGDEDYQHYHAFGAAIFGEPRNYGVNLTLEY